MNFDLTYREATTNDITQMHRIRMVVKENVLNNPDLVKISDYEEYITDRGRGWVCEHGPDIVGFSIVDLSDNNVWALFIDPGFEGKGIGRKLHDLMLDWYFSQTNNRIWLGTAPETRAESFYRKKGWKFKGARANGELLFEMESKDWMTGK